MIGVGGGELSSKAALDKFVLSTIVCQKQNTTALRLFQANLVQHCFVLLAYLSLSVTLVFQVEDSGQTLQEMFVLLVCSILSHSENSWRFHSED